MRIEINRSIGISFPELARRRLKTIALPDENRQ
jgi:hypothetical protein